MFADFLGYFEKILFEVKTTVVTFIATFEIIVLLFTLASGHTVPHRDSGFGWEGGSL